MTIENLTNGVVKGEERPGRAMECPSCTTSFKFTILNITPLEDVYLYCDTCSNFVLREEDRQKTIRLRNDGENNLEKEIQNIYTTLEQSLPTCECGGHFKIWSNVKCPACNYEFPYNNGVKNLQFRLQEGHLVWVEGAIAYRGQLEPSNKLAAVKSV